MELINFVLGDWSGDGHEKTETYTVECNKTIDEIRAIHNSAQNSIGVRLNGLCEEYEESVISEDDAKALYVAFEAAGFDDGILSLVGEKKADPDEEFGYYVEPNDNLWHNGLIDIWLHALKAIDPSFEFEIKKIPTMNGLGYGLFH